MTHLLDTHAWVQRVLDEPLPLIVERTLTERSQTLAISDISLWEVAKLVETKRVEFTVSLAEFFRMAITPELTVLPVTAEIAVRVSQLEKSGFHKDPADQLIVATALAHNLCLISDDTRIRQWGGVRMLWRSANR
jgi:PIN domain nuclease of toxin-antitoxin system